MFVFSNLFKVMEIYEIYTKNSFCVLFTISHRSCRFKLCQFCSCWCRSC